MDRTAQTRLITGAPNVQARLREMEKKKKLEMKAWIKRVNVERKSEGLGPIANNPSRHGYSKPGWELRKKTDYSEANPFHSLFRYEEGTTRPSYRSRARNRPPTASPGPWPRGPRMERLGDIIPGYSSYRHAVGKFLTKHAPSVAETFKLDDLRPEYSWTRPAAEKKYLSLTAKAELKAKAEEKKRKTKEKYEAKKKAGKLWSQTQGGA